MVVIKWLNHKEIAGCPNLKYFFDINDIEILIIIPKIIEIIIKIFIKFGIIIICSGLIIHDMNVPEIIDKGVIHKIGISIKFLGWKLISGLDFK